MLQCYTSFVWGNKVAETNTDCGTLNGGTAVLQTSRLARETKYKTRSAAHIMRLLAYLYLLCQSGALFAVPTFEKVHDFIVTPLASETNTVIVATTNTTLHIIQATHSFELYRIRFSPTTLTTMAPLSRNALELRQRYVKEQGSGMDCGTWAGSHYTRVLPVS